jgi:hypothetical protein
LDETADDRGIETNSLGGSVNTRVGRNTQMIFSSGYNLRNARRSNPAEFEHQRARIAPPRIDIQYQMTNNILLDFNETYSLFDTAARRNVNTPLNTSGGIQVGNQADLVSFSHRFSYSKTPSGQEAQLIFNDRFRFFLTPKWYLDTALSYRAVAPRNMEYKKVFPIERSLSVVRDMHCWILRAQFSSRPGVREASFYIDLKTNLAGAKNVFTGRPLDEFYPYAQPTPDESEIFPAPASTNPEN